jgi:uncharacterized protein YkwD
MAKKTKNYKNHQSRKTSHTHNKNFLKVYWPYIPLLLLVILSMIFGVLMKPTPRATNVLAYATNISTSGLLSATNDQRTANGLAALTSNSLLNSAAQAKANDMVARNYWSHNTPDGKEPWVFIDATGYTYQKAGENLAYGFATSYDTVIGWMNSPSHRANVLDSAFREVGFGFANSENFVGSGQQTVVVAMYGNPIVYVPPSAPPPPVTATAPTPKPVVASQNNNVPLNIQEAEKPETAPVNDEPLNVPQKLSPDRINQPVTTDVVVPRDAQEVTITRLQRLTRGNAPWSAVALTAITFSIVLVWVIKHIVLVKRFVVSGEHFVAHHPVIDLVVVIIAALAVYLSQSSGVVL